MKPWGQIRMNVLLAHTPSPEVNKVALNMPMPTCSEIVYASSQHRVPKILHSVVSSASSRSGDRWDLRFI